jgi:hypothetical protein
VHRKNRIPSGGLSQHVSGRCLWYTPPPPVRCLQVVRRSMLDEWGGWASAARCGTSSSNRAWALSCLDEGRTVCCGTRTVRCGARTVCGGARTVCCGTRTVCCGARTPFNISNRHPPRPFRLLTYSIDPLVLAWCRTTGPTYRHSASVQAANVRTTQQMHTHAHTHTYMHTHTHTRTRTRTCTRTRTHIRFRFASGRTSSLFNYHAPLFLFHARQPFVATVQACY